MSTLRVDNIQGETADAKNRFVVQVVHGALGAETGYSSSADADLLSVSITPTSVNNKIFLMGNFAIYINSETNTDRGDFEFKRNGTVVFQSGTGGYGYFRLNGHMKVMNTTHNFLDAPATTSSVTYTMTHAPHTYGAGGSFMAQSTNLTLMEIAQ